MPKGASSRPIIYRSAERNEEPEHNKKIFINSINAKIVFIYKYMYVYI